MNNSVNPFLDKRYPKKDDKKQFLIELSVYLNSKQFRISMGLYATPADFEKAVGSKSVSEPLKANGDIKTKSAQVEFIPYSLKHLNEMLDVFFRGELSLYAMQSPRYDLRFAGEEGNVQVTHWDYAPKNN